jgi:hypothetical protein
VVENFNGFLKMKDVDEVTLYLLLPPYIWGDKIEVSHLWEI